MDMIQQLKLSDTNKLHNELYTFNKKMAKLHVPYVYQMSVFKSMKHE